MAKRKLVKRLTAREVAHDGRHERGSQRLKREAGVEKKIKKRTESSDRKRRKQSDGRWTTDLLSESRA